MKKVLFTSLCVLTLSFVKAQDYQTSGGLRLGVPYGLTVKHFLSETGAIEGILAGHWSGSSITALYEIHAPVGDVSGLNVYYGGGAHAAFYNNYRWNGRYYGSRSTFIGIDGILGLEYTLADVPINVSLDWKPTMHLFEYAGLWTGEGAISVRYCF